MPLDHTIISGCLSIIDIKKSFDHKGSELLKNAICKVHHNQDEDNLIPTHVREELERQWQEDPEWLEKKRKNTQSRKSDEGLSKHTGGSIPVIAHKKKLDEYQKRVSERDSQRLSREETIDIHLDNNIYLDIVGGISKKKRIYDLGYDVVSHASSSSTFAKGCSQSEIEAMRSLVASLNT